MDLRRAVHELVSKCRVIGVRFRTNEQEAIKEVDLVMLRAQLFLLDCAAANLQELKRLRRTDPDLNVSGEP
jgi:hypothetical protein